MAYLFEIPEQILPVPARVAELLPGVVVTCGATREEHAIDNGPSPYDSPSVEGARPSIKSGLRYTRINALVLVGDRQTGYNGTIFLAIAVGYSELVLSVMRP